MIENEGKLQFTLFEPNMYDDLKMMWSIFYCYSIKGVIEVSATIERPVDDIIRRLQCPELPIFNNM